MGINVPEMSAAAPFSSSSSSRRISVLLLFFSGDNHLAVSYRERSKGEQATLHAYSYELYSPGRSTGQITLRNNNKNDPEKRCCCIVSYTHSSSSSSPKRREVVGQKENGWYARLENFVFYFIFSPFFFFFSSRAASSSSEQSSRGPIGLRISICAGPRTRPWLLVERRRRRTALRLFYRGDNERNQNSCSGLFFFAFYFLFFLLKTNDLDSKSFSFLFFFSNVLEKMPLRFPTKREGGAIIRLARVSLSTVLISHSPRLNCGPSWAHPGG